MTRTRDIRPLLPARLRRGPSRRSRGLTLLTCSALLLTACTVAPPPRPGAPPVAVPPATLPPPRDVLSVPDAVPRLEPRAKLGNPAFYDVLGRRYFVLASADGYVERGVASWYGPTFNGVSTAIGESYDMYGMTAAHKTLPLPAYARVTNLRNGRSVVVRINDRGPFVSNRLIDLSYTAAAKLDMIREGTALVEVRALTPGVPEGTPVVHTALSAPPTLYIQAGAFANESNARRLLSRLHSAGLANAFVLGRGETRRLYRVRVGPVATVSDFDALAARLAQLGIPDARLAGD